MKIVSFPVGLELTNWLTENISPFLGSFDALNLNDLPRLQPYCSWSSNPSSSMIQLIQIHQNHYSSLQLQFLYWQSSSSFFSAVFFSGHPLDWIIFCMFCKMKMSTVQNEVDSEWSFWWSPTGHHIQQVWKLSILKWIAEPMPCLHSFLYSTKLSQKDLLVLLLILLTHLTCPCCS